MILKNSVNFIEKGQMPFQSEFCLQQSPKFKYKGGFYYSEKLFFLAGRSFGRFTSRASRRRLKRENKTKDQPC